jgi:hypothetical protein
MSYIKDAFISITQLRERILNEGMENNIIKYNLKMIIIKLRDNLYQQKTLLKKYYEVNNLYHYCDKMEIEIYFLSSDEIYDYFWKKDNDLINHINDAYIIITDDECY